MNMVEIDTTHIRGMQEADIDYFADAFFALGWGDRREALQLYYNEQAASLRVVLVAEYNSVPAGYVTLVPSAAVGPFAGQHIPEIKDFNVLPSFRRLGVGSRLMDEIEAVAKKTCGQIALGVGLYGDYGAAQRMYVKRGYIPDGSGVWWGNNNLAPYKNCVNDDDLNLFFVKQLI